jgi:hypothetical protein
MIGSDAARTHTLIIAASLLGIPLFLALHLAFEARGRSGVDGSDSPGPEGVGRVESSGPRGAAPRVLGAYAAGVLFLVGWFGLSRAWSDEMAATRILHLAAVLHLLVALVPLRYRLGTDGFWQYNRMLFLRFLLAVFYSVSLFAGLAVAIASIDALFGVAVAPESYLRLWFFQAFVFNTWFLLAGIPTDLREMERHTDYPLALKFFTQFVLIPLVTVYLVILTAYFGKVLVTWSWPSGWIGWLVSSVAVAGTLALLLVHPLREREDSSWVDVYGRWFYVALLPSIGMLFFAIGQRIGQYGFTERRYFLLVLSCYLAGIAVYYAVTASKNIRIIPLALAGVTAFSLVGPWSAYSVSRRSQLARAMAGFEVMAVPGTVDMADANSRTGSALTYLLAMHGADALGSLRPASAEALTPPLDRSQIRRLVEQVFTGRGLEYRPAGLAFSRVVLSLEDPAAPIALEDFEWLFEVVFSGDDAATRPLSGTEDGMVSLETSADGQSLRVQLASGGSVTLNLGERLAAVVEAPSTGRLELPVGQLTFDAESDQVAMRVVVRDAILVRDESGDRLGRTEVVVLVKVKPS